MRIMSGSPVLLIQQKRDEKLCKDFCMFLNEEAASLCTASVFRVFQSWTAGQKPPCIRKVLRQANFIKVFLWFFAFLNQILSWDPNAGKLDRSLLSQYFSLTDLAQIFPTQIQKPSCHQVSINTVHICNIQETAEETMAYSNTRLVIGKLRLLQTAD